LRWNSSALRTTFGTEGIWYANATVDGQVLNAPFEVSPAGTPGVVVIGTGGLSHQLTGATFGTVYPQWDREFLQLLEESPQQLTLYSVEDFARLGGEHSIEVLQWIAMRAALPTEARMELRFYYPYGLMGYGIAGFRVP
jgi:protocatechuate 4,5-dioxygenase beta chain